MRWAVLGVLLFLETAVLADPAPTAYVEKGKEPAWLSVAAMVSQNRAVFIVRIRKDGGLDLDLQRFTLRFEHGEFQEQPFVIPVALKQDANGLYATLVVPADVGRKASLSLGVESRDAKDGQAWYVIPLERYARCADRAAQALSPEFESEFDRLFLSREPFRYQDNVQFLLAIENRKLNPDQRVLVRGRLKAFLSAKPQRRPYAADSDHTGVASEASFLRLQAVQLLAKIGEKEDAAFLRGIDPKAEDEHPVFGDACRSAIKELEAR